tara:strand:+ start:166 stop:399 length:234 start_codon:yes stop_codon:yes gene_type:complete
MTLKFSILDFFSKPIDFIKASLSNLRNGLRIFSSPKTEGIVESPFDLLILICSIFFFNLLFFGSRLRAKFALFKVYS